MRRTSKTADQAPPAPKRKWSGAGYKVTVAAVLLAGAVGLVSTGALSADKSEGFPLEALTTPPTLEETRLAMGKSIELQQTISKERKDWQQGKEILVGRLELVKKEIATLEEKIQQAESSIADANTKRAGLLAENDQLKAAGAQLTGAVTEMEGGIRRLYKSLQEPLQTKPTLLALYQRMPEDPNKTRVSAAERFQNVLGILNEVNKANSEIMVNFEDRDLGGGRLSQVKAVYIGLAQAYCVSANGEAGIGRPTAEGWKWESSKAIASDVLKTLEIIEGKQTAVFVPLPVKLK